MPSLKAQGNRGSRFPANAHADSMINDESMYLNYSRNHFLQALELGWWCIGLQGSLWQADVSAAGLALAVDALGAGRERRRSDGRNWVALGKSLIPQWHVLHSLTAKTR